MPESGKLATLCHTNIEIFVEVRGLEDANSGGDFVNYYPGALPWSHVTETRWTFG